MLQSHFVLCCLYFSVSNHYLAFVEVTAIGVKSELSKAYVVPLKAVLIYEAKIQFPGNHF